MVTGESGAKQNYHDVQDRKCIKAEEKAVGNISGQKGLMLRVASSRV